MARVGSPVGLKDVAALAGVSVKTVSNVVNGYIHVSSATRARVQEAIEELNYRPNLSARSLRSGRSGIVALAMPELQLPYFAELARWVIAAAARHGWTVLIDQTDGELERERLVMSGIRNQLIDGLILSPLACGHEELANREDQVPLVLLGERVWDGPADHVAIDNVAASREATTHLVGLGRQRIAAIGEQPDRPPGTSHLRLRGYRTALEDGGLPFDPDLVAPAENYRRADGAAAMARLLDLATPPDAVFCFSDMQALGALRTLAERGLRVPEDVAVVGFDDVEDGRFSLPSLTTIRPDKERIATLAVDLLAGRISREDTREPQEVLAPHELVVRESTAGGQPRVPVQPPAQRSSLGS
jgi:DNA-binding LacI/PurR family transcriptional regulator